MKKVLIFVVVSFAFSTFALGQTTPSDLKDLVGARASSGDTTMRQRGYTDVKTENGSDRKWTNWWNESKRACVTVATVEGRFNSITSTLPADCGKSSDAPSTGGGSNSAPADLKDLVGARASSGDTAMRSRGYADVKTETGSDRKWTNWWNQSKRACVTVATVQGRFDSITATLPADCGKSADSPSTGGGNNSAPADVKDLVGARASSGETALTQRGYRFVKVTKGDDRTWSNWWNARRKVCLNVVTVEGRYETIMTTMKADCGR